MTSNRLSFALALALTACGGALDNPPLDPPPCAGFGFQLSVGQPVTLRFDGPTTVHVLGGEASIEGSGSDVVRVEVLSSDDSTPRVVGPQGEFLAAEVRMCRGAENVWPTALEQP